MENVIEDLFSIGGQFEVDARDVGVFANSEIDSPSAGGPGAKSRSACRNVEDGGATGPPGRYRGNQCRPGRDCRRIDIVDRRTGSKHFRRQTVDKRMGRIGKGIVMRRSSDVFDRASPSSPVISRNTLFSRVAGSESSLHLRLVYFGKPNFEVFEQDLLVVGRFRKAPLLRPSTECTLSTTLHRSSR